MAKSDQKDIQQRILGTPASPGVSHGGNTTVGANAGSPGLIDQAQTDYNESLDRTNSRSSDYYNRTQPDYNAARDVYSNFATTGGLNPDDVNRLREIYGGIGGAGGRVSNPLEGRESEFRNLSSAASNAYRPDYSAPDTTYSRLANGGGLTPEDIGTVSRDTLKEFEQTGGYSAADLSNIRARSSASAPAFYTNLRNDLNRSRQVTGSNVGAPAVNFRLAREQSQAENANRINTELGLSDSIRAGRMGASEALSGANLNLLGLRSQNELAGAGGLSSNQTSLGNWGLGQAGLLDQFGLSRAGGLDTWATNYAQMEQAAQNANASAGRSSAAQQAEMERWLMEQGISGRQYGADSLADMYRFNTDTAYNYDTLGLDTLNSQYGTQGDLLALAAQNRGRTAMENATQISGAIAGIAPAIMTDSPKRKTAVMPRGA